MTFGISILLEVFLILLAFLLFLFVLGLLLILLFYKKNVLFMPRMTLFWMTFLKSPLNYIFSKKKDYLEYSRIWSLMAVRTQLENYSKVPYSDRALFLPQCLRSPECPAPVSPEGVKCVGCGRCGIGEIDKFAKKLGIKLFIAPGSTYTRRMIKKYKPKGAIGVACPIELREWIESVSNKGIAITGVLLTHDGCVDTRVNVKEVLEAMTITENLKVPEKIQKEIDNIAPKISSKWSRKRICDASGI